MTRKDIDNIISIISPNDEDFEKPIISPAFLKKELEALALEQEPCEDAVSRQAVIDGINRYFHDDYYQRTSIQDCRDCLIEDVINKLPPVTTAKDGALDKMV